MHGQHGIPLLGRDLVNHAVPRKSCVHRLAVIMPLQKQLACAEELAGLVRIQHKHCSIPILKDLQIVRQQAGHYKGDKCSGQ